LERCPRGSGVGVWTSADPPATLLMTQGEDGFPIDLGCTDPRSQTRDLGHPSICYLVISPSTCRRQVRLLGMPKGRTVLSPASRAGRANRRSLRFASVGMTNSLGPKDRTADPSAALGMTKGRAALPSASHAGQANGASPAGFPPTGKDPRASFADASPLRRSSNISTSDALRRWTRIARTPRLMRKDVCEPQSTGPQR